MQRAESFAAHYLGFSVASFAPNLFGVDVHERVQLRIEPCDLREMSLGQFDWRDLLLADLAAPSSRPKGK